MSELTTESGRLIEQVGQQVIVGVTSLQSKDPKIRSQSKELVERTLDEIAPGLYRGMTVATVDYSKAETFLNRLGLQEEDMPVIYVTDAVTDKVITYQGELDANSIRAWAIDILKDN